MEKEIRNAVAKLNEIKKELVTSKWNFKSFDETIEDIKVDLDFIKEYNFINIMEEAYLVEAFSRKGYAEKDNLEKKGNLIELSKIHVNLLRLKEFFYSELEECINLQYIEYVFYSKGLRDCFYKNLQKTYGLKSIIAVGVGFKYDFPSEKVERLVYLISMCKILLGDKKYKTIEKYVNYYLKGTPEQFIKYLIEEIKSIDVKLKHEIGKTQEYLVSLNLISGDVLKKFEKLSKIKDFYIILKKSELYKVDKDGINDMNCFAIIDIDNNKYMTKNGVKDKEGEKKIKDLLSKLLSDRTYVPIHDDTRYYREDSSFITYKNYKNYKNHVKNDVKKDGENNRMFTCCEKKLFINIPEEVENQEIRLVVTKPLCPLCVRAYNYYKNKEIKIIIHTVEDTSGNLDILKFDDLASKIKNNSTVNGRIK